MPGWHQDGAFLGQGIRTVNVWIALTDCGVDAPSMDMVPRRMTDIVPTGTEGALMSWTVSQILVEDAAGEAGHELPLFGVALEVQTSQNTWRGP